MRDALLHLIYRLGIPSLLRLKKNGFLTVLCLHRISDERDFFFNPIQVKTFELLIDYLSKYYTIIPFFDAEKKTLKPKLILSFNDGYYDFIEHAMPILKKKGLPANHNIVNDCVNNNATIWTQQLNDIFNHLRDNEITNDKDINQLSNFENNWNLYYLTIFKKFLSMDLEHRVNLLNMIKDKYKISSSYRMMNWDDIKYISKNDVEIGSHTYNHNPLSIINGKQLFQTEILNSIDEINTKIGKSINILSLPNGVANSELSSFIEKSTIKYVLLVDDKINKMPLQNATNYISRIYLMDNPIYETILRTECFHSILKR